MKTAAGFLVVVGLFALANAAAAQQTKPAAAAPTISSELNTQLSIVEREVVSAAEAMPEYKYSFAPTNGEFKGVRTFAQEVKHIATANFAFYSAILGQEPPAGVVLNETSNGPDDIQSKQQIVKYLKDSFALGHKAFATITARNATAVLAKPPVPFFKTRLMLASFGCTHAFDHYGQMVEYLRMNGIVPPASKGQPPANPASR
jgi:uncharacterized damage-inducible protein DinB